MTYSGPLHSARLAVASCRPARPREQCGCCLCELKERFRCSACKQVYYCSAHCQEVGWRSGHSVECGKAAAVQESEAESFFIVKWPSACQDVLAVASREYCELRQDMRPRQKAVVRLERPVQFSNDWGTKAPQGSTCDDREAGENTATHRQPPMIQVKSCREIYVSFLGEEPGPGRPLILPESPECYSPGLYEGLRGVCSICKGPADVEGKKCLKCGAAWDGAQGNALETLRGLADLGRKAQELLGLPPGPNYEELRSLTQKISAGLKENAVHHLSSGLYFQLCCCFRTLQQSPPGRLFKEIESTTAPTTPYALGYALLKQSVHRFGMNSWLTFCNLRVIVEVLGVYTLAELELRGPPPLQQEFSGERHAFSREDMEKMAQAAEELLPGHRNALSFAGTLKEIAEASKDETLMATADRLAAAIDIRVENLESWLLDGEDDGQDEREFGDMVVQGTPFQEGSQPPAKQNVLQ